VLLSLNVSDNNLGELVLPEGWRSKDGDDNYPWIGPDGQEQNANPKKPLGIISIAKAISNMRALSTFTFSGDCSSSQPVTMETTMTEADFSGKKLCVSGGMMVAAFLPKCQ
jgi:hypothetical protein